MGKTFISLIEYIICNVVIIFRYYCKICSQLCRFSFFIPCLSINFLSFFVLSVHVLSASVSINVIKKGYLGGESANTLAPRAKTLVQAWLKNQGTLVLKPVQKSGNPGYLENQGYQTYQGNQGLSLD